MKIVFFEVHDWEKEYLLKAMGLEHDTCLFYLGKLQDTNMDEWRDADILCTFIYSEVPADIIHQMPNLKAIVTRSTGYNHIDLGVAKEKNVVVCNVPTYGENTVAEHTFALILNISRKVHKSYVRTLQGDFRIEDLRGFDLQGRTLGVIGAGHIGQHVIKIAKGFGMHVVASDHHENAFLSSLLHYRYVDLDTLYKESDIISIHVPLVQGTQHLINAQAISKMKDGVILINTARGEVVDTAALLDGLSSGKIAGAGLDVIEGEKLVLEEERLRKECKEVCDTEEWNLLHKDHEILRHPNVVFTPHNAFNSQEAIERILDTSAQNVRAIVIGQRESVKGNIVQ